MTAASVRQPSRFLGYMAGRSTPLFIKVVEQMVAQLGPKVEVFHLVIGDLYNYKLACAQKLSPKIRLAYQHEIMDPFRHPTKVDSQRLAEYEGKYGLPHLRQYILSHRLIDFMEDQKRLAYLQTYLDYYESLWEQTRPDVFVTGGQDSLMFLAANAVFKQNGAIPLVMIPGRIPTRFLVIDNHLELIPNLRATFEAMDESSLSIEEVLTIKEMRKGFVERRMRLAAFDLGHRVKPFPSPRRLFSNVLRRFQFQDWFFDQRPLDDMCRSAVIRLRWPFQQIDQKRLEEKGIPESKFFFYPLHYEPEATIDVQGTIYRDQWHIIKRVSSALPLGYSIYIKEHPNMFSGLRRLGFYRDLVKLGNVRLISPSIDGHELIACCQGVITIAGTAGFEALFYGKPVLMFGRSFYEDFHEGVFRAGSYEEIALALRRMCDGIQFEPAQFDRFIAAILRRSYPGINELPAAGVDEPSNHAALAKGLLAELEFRLTRAA